MTFTYQRKWVDARISDARLNKQRAYAQLLHESNYLSAIIPAIHQRFREMYAMTLQHKAIHLLPHSRHLQPYVLYQHIIKSDFVKSYPLKFDTERAIPQRFQIPFSTLNIQPINHSSPNPITPILRRTLPKFINPSTQKSPLRQPETKLNTHTYHIHNQTYMILPWQWSNTSDIRQDFFRTEFTFSFIKRQFYKLLHIINNKYIATRRFLTNLFHKRIKCDT